MKQLNNSLYRIKILVSYYNKTSFQNKSRIFLILVWPIVDLLIWGFATKYLQQNESPVFLISILNAFIFWSMTMKSQQEVSYQFMQDVYSRNFSNLIVTPLQDSEILLALIISSLSKLFLVFSTLFIFSNIFYSISLFHFGIQIISYLLNLIIFGWSLGIIATAFIIRFGYKMEFIAWSLALLIQPFSCVFYPRSLLPNIFRSISYFVPISYVFENMRSKLSETSYSISHMLYAFLLNIICLITACIIYILMINWSRRKGSLLKL